MTTGCNACDEVQERKGDKTSLCDYHTLEELEHTAWAARQDYEDALDKYIEKLRTFRKVENE